MMTYRSVRKPPREDNLAERIYQRIKQEIFDWQLLPGDRFTETELAERMDASRTPVREALVRLQREGYVEVQFRNGWTIRPFDFRSLENLYDVRVILELAALRMLCDSADIELRLEPLCKVWMAPLEARPQEGRDIAELDERFHEHLVESTGNDEMARIHHDVTERIRIVRRLDFTMDRRIEATYAEHSKILNVLLSRRTEHAQQLLRTHIEESKAEVRKITLHMLDEARNRARR
ncbi:GntR family transcriptional regulator [Solimonas marina]|uniref:GntR family transcriptional regulator n=1 Tax=Solimonas marina TaxID=2714601 RepID=A0A969WAB7_9GAMM|nr:GntR family transcriptional regulator [Solimonas marina]NKF23582.1 GntR family transcriptional regulator [Solimonas marina]